MLAFERKRGKSLRSFCQLAERAGTGAQGSTCAQRPPLSSTGHRSPLSSLLRACGRGIPQSQETPAHPLPTTTPASYALTRHYTEEVPLTRNSTYSCKAFGNESFQVTKCEGLYKVASLSLDREALLKTILFDECQDTSVPETLSKGTGPSQSNKNLLTVVK